MFSALPVAILAWVLASMSGLTRSAMSARRPLPVAIAASSASSGSDSTLTHRMPASTAAASSASVLPTPENMILSGAMPAASARCQFAARHHVGAGAEPRQGPDHGLVGIGLHRIADKRRRSPRRRRRTHCNGASASPSNSNRTACRPRLRAGRAPRLRRGARRRDRRNGAWPSSWAIGRAAMLAIACQASGIGIARKAHKSPLHPICRSERHGAVDDFPILMLVARSWPCMRL